MLLHHLRNRSCVIQVSCWREIRHGIVTISTKNKFGGARQGTTNTQQDRCIWQNYGDRTTQLQRLQSCGTLVLSKIFRWIKLHNRILTAGSLMITGRPHDPL